MKIDGKTIASDILAALKPNVEELKKRNITPTLAIILIGNNESSKSYIKQKQIKAEEIGANIKLHHLEEITETELLQLIKKLNQDPSIHGIIVQRPLPNKFDRNAISQAINVEKDVDGFNDLSKFDAPVAEAVIEILDRISYDYKHKKIVVIGKGETAGRPVIKLLNKLNLTPTVIDSKTINPEEIIKSANVIISAVGKENTINPNELNENQIVIGVGLFSVEGQLKGDYDQASIDGRVKYYTPTIGGVGPVNVAMLMRNLVQAASESM